MSSLICRKIYKFHTYVIPMIKKNSIRGKKVRLRDYFGILSKEAGEALEEEIIKRRKEHLVMRKKRLERISKELSE